MGRKMKLDGNCGSKFITIDDEKKWALIREIATVDRYKRPCGQNPGQGTVRSVLICVCILLGSSREETA